MENWFCLYILNIRVDHSRFLFGCLTRCSESNLSIPQLCVCVCVFACCERKREGVSMYVCMIWVCVHVCMYIHVCSLCAGFLWLLSYMKCTSNALFNQYCLNTYNVKLKLFTIVLYYTICMLGNTDYFLFHLKEEITHLYLLFHLRNVLPNSTKVLAQPLQFLRECING